MGLLPNWIAPRSLDDFHKLAGSFQSLVFGAGLIIAGVQAVSVLHSWERARAELEDVRRKLNHTELDLAVDARQAATDTEDGRYLEVKITVENKGSKAVRLRFDPNRPPIKVSQVHFDLNQGSPKSFDPAISGQVYADLEPASLILEKDMLPSEVYRYTTLLHVREPGIYFVIFKTAVDTLDASGSGSWKGDWISSTYAIVR